MSLSTRIGAPSRRPYQVRRGARAAFTLIELMIVLVILVLASAIAYPAVKMTLRSQRLKSAAETMRIEWSRAHVKAMKTGRIQVFRYEMGGSQFSIQPWIAADEGTEAAVDQAPGFGSTPVAADPLDDAVTKTLPEGVTFAAGDAKFDSRAYEVEDFFQQSGSGDAVAWSRPVLFYPDGSASDSYVIVTDEQQKAYRIQLRGLTGTSYVGEIDSLENQLANLQPGQVTP
jgi:prepilin-type N-terminal cleavage/methylation domain-containing protein